MIQQNHTHSDYIVHVLQHPHRGKWEGTAAMNPALMSTEVLDPQELELEPLKKKQGAGARARATKKFTGSPALLVIL